jgi:hypothetical protein
VGLIQTVKQPTVNWVHGTPRPLTLFGDVGWRDVIVRTTALILEESTIKETTIFDCSMTKAFRPGGALGATTLPAPVGGSFVSVGARVVTGGNLCNAGKKDTRGYFFSVHANCSWSITKSSQHVLAHGTLESLESSHCSDKATLVGLPLALEIQTSGNEITGRLAGQRVASVTDGEYASGFASMAGGWHRALFADISVNHAAARALGT